jgi:hypothetical protein
MLVNNNNLNQYREEDIIKFGFSVYTNPTGLFEYKKRMWIYTSFFMSISFIIIGISLFSRYNIKEVKTTAGIVLIIGILAGLLGIYINYYYHQTDNNPVLLSTIQPNSPNAINTWNQFLQQNRFYRIEINYFINNV